jgi:hypothetical protein
MPHQLLLIAFTLLYSSTLQAEQKPDMYINANVGFNVPGYNYQQNNLPCDVDKALINQVVKQGKKSGLEFRPVKDKESILNGIIPVLAIDFETLILGQDGFNFGAENAGILPASEVTVAIITGDSVVTSSHQCAITSLKELTPASDILDLGPVHSVCSATQQCMKKLGNKVFTWLENKLSKDN